MCSLKKEAILTPHWIAIRLQSCLPMFDESAKHKPWANSQPPNHVRGHVPCKVHRGSKSVRMCASFLFTMARVSISGSVGSGANASDLLVPDDTPFLLLCSIPHAVTQGEIVGGGGTSGRLRGRPLSSHCVMIEEKEMTKSLRSAFRCIECRGLLPRRQSVCEFVTKPRQVCSERRAVGWATDDSTLTRDWVLNQRPSGRLETSRTDGLSNTPAVDESRSPNERWYGS